MATYDAKRLRQMRKDGRLPQRPAPRRYTPEHIEELDGATAMLAFITSHKPGDVLHFRRVGERAKVYLRVISREEYEAAK